MSREVLVYLNINNRDIYNLCTDLNLEYQFGKLKKLIKKTRETDLI